MDHALSAQQVDDYNRAFELGTSLMEPHIELAGRIHRRRPGWLVRRRLRKAIGALELALGIVPSSWPAWWSLGKVWQRMRDYPKALQCFARAHAINPEHPDVAREAAISAIDVGAGEDAVRFARAAVALHPADPGLVCNLALALLIAGDVPGAVAAVAEAARAAPEDPITAGVRGLIAAVANGERARPVSGAELW